MNQDGSDQQTLTTNPGFDAAPAWSPDVRMITFASNRMEPLHVAQLLVMDADSSDLRVVSKSPNTKQLISEWNPKGRECILLAEPMNESAHWELQQIDVETGTARTILDTEVEFSPPPWHPDGNSIAYVRSSATGEQI